MNWLNRSCRLFLLLTCLGGLFAVFPSDLALAQKRLLRSDYYSVDEGLPDRQVTSIVQDGDGFIWVGTPNGLARFDGYEFLLFNDHPDNANRISLSSVEQLRLDRRGNLLIFYDNVRYRFDVLNPHSLEVDTVFTNFVRNDLIGEARAYHVSPEGDVFVLTAQSELGSFLYQYQPDSSAFDLVFHLEDLQRLGTSVDLIQLADSTFLLNDSNIGLRLFDRHGHLLQNLNPAIQALFPGTEAVARRANFLHRDVNGTVWISLASLPRVLQYQPEQGRLTVAAALPADGMYNAVWEDRRGNLLFANAQINRSLVYNTRRLTCVEPNGAVHDFSQLIEINDRIRAIEGAHFFETIYLGHESGLSIVQSNRPKVTTYLAQSLREDRRGARMRGVVADGRGLVYFAQESGRWYVLDHDIDYLEPLNLIDRQTGQALETGCSFELALDSLGNLWGISCTNDGRGQLLRLNLQDCLTDAYTSDYQFTAMALSRHGHFWLAGQRSGESGALLHYDTSQQVAQRVLDRDGSNPLQGSTIFYLLEGSEGTVWIGTNDGLFSYDPNRQRWDELTKGQVSAANSLSSNTIYTIHQDSTGRLWLGTREGVNVYNPISGDIQIIDKRNGLADYNVCGILPDGQGNYWFSTFNGLSFYDPERAQMRNFYTADGLSHNEFNRFSFARDPYNQRLYFGGMNGMNAFQQDVLLESQPPGPVVLTRLTRYDSRSDSLITLEAKLSDLEEVQIKPYDIYFQFHFMLPDYSSPHRNQFAAWLEGYEDQWSNLGNTPNIRFNKLPAGLYTLHLKGADPNGNWSTETRSIRVRVEPIFYRTLWFQALALLALVALIYGWIKYRLEQKLKVERLRTKISSDLHDEVSGLLGGIAMQTDLLQEMVEDQESRSRLAGIGTRIRRAMSKMSDVIWSIDSRNDRVDDLLLRMHEHADEVLRDLAIDYEFHIGNLDRQVTMPVKVRQELYFIFKEAINNIAKHSNATKVDVAIGNKGQLFEMVVHDNGSSPAEAKHAKTGQGLANIRMRAQRIKAKLDIFNGDGYTINLSMKKFA